MAQKKPMLSSVLVARKGDAKSTRDLADLTAPTKPAAPTLSNESPKDAVKLKALTVKLGPAQYKRLKAAGVDVDKPSQAIFVEALEAWLVEHGY